MTTPVMRPRGIRNNNPGNIRFDGTQWRGIKGDDGAFCIFDVPENGIRAIAKILGNYDKRNINTVRKIITEWAPPSENDTEAYIAAVCKFSNLTDRQNITINEWHLLISAIIEHENGQQPYTPEQILDGIARAR
jgi:hypothetical protein